MGDDGGITEDSEVYSLSDLEESTIYQDGECRKNRVLPVCYERGGEILV